jgi:hypothetical protein
VAGRRPTPTPGAAEGSTQARPVAASDPERAAHCGNMMIFASTTQAHWLRSDVSCG